MQKPPLHGYRTLFTFSIARIRHVARPLARSRYRRIKIEANIVAVVLPPTRPRARTHVASVRASLRRALRELAEAADKYRPRPSTRMFTLNLRANASAQGYQTRERRSSSAKVENRHGSLGNKMRAPALPWGWGPLDNPYCTPHPLVLPPYVRPSRRRPWPYILRSAGRVLSGLVAPERNPTESICGRLAPPKFLKNGGRAAGNFCKFSI